MTSKKKLHLFQAYGIELEYMIVDKDSLDIRPIADQLLKAAAGDYVEDYVNGPITWSNELALHVIELKCSEPTADLVALSKDFHDNVLQINEILARFNAQLMPTGAHPWMNPGIEAKLWPHSNNDIYQKYNELFNCQGHGWSNLQSMHINLPFYDGEEFAALHAAIRVILPIIPALSASTPILDLHISDVLDRRLIYYQKNQSRIPSITGRVIPERAFSRRQYQKLIYDPIAKDIAPYDPDKILDPIWLNSRGAIARFDRGSIEIRIIDLQESPKADLAIACFVILIIKLLVKEKISTCHQQQTLATNGLKEIFNGVVKRTGDFVINDKNYLSSLGVEEDQIMTRDLLISLYTQVQSHYPKEFEHWSDTIKTIIDEGSLSNRLVKRLGKNFAKDQVFETYETITDCLQSNLLFQP